jgi:hypothetical protein
MKIHVLGLTTIIGVHNVSNVLICCIVSYIFSYGICTFIFVQSLQITYKYCGARNARRQRMLWLQRMLTNAISSSLLWP